MADISKCANGETCSLRMKCYRYLVDPGRRQSYFAPPEPGPKCEYFIPSNEFEIPDRNESRKEEAVCQLKSPK